MTYLVVGQCGKEWEVFDWRDAREDAEASADAWRGLKSDYRVQVYAELVDEG